MFKKILWSSFLIITILMTTFSSNAVYFWSAGVTQEGSITYPLIGSLCEIANTYVGDVVYMTPIAYTKSVAGLKGYDQGEVVSMYASSQQLEQVFTKTDIFGPPDYEWKTPITQMMWMYDSEYFFIIRKEDEDKIKCWNDLVGKTVYLHMVGTGTRDFFNLTLGPDGLDIIDKMDVKGFDMSHAADALKLGEVDAVAGNSAGGKLIAWNTEVLGRVDCSLVFPTAEELQKAIKNFHYIYTVEIPPDAWSEEVKAICNFTEPKIVPAFGYVYIVNPEVPEEVVYSVVKAAFEHADEMAAVAPIWQKFAMDPFGYNLPFLQTYKDFGVPIHPGVLRYLKELGHDTIKLGLE